MTNIPDPYAVYGNKFDKDGRFVDEPPAVDLGRIERIARALHRANDLSERGMEWDSEPEPVRKHYRALARAAWGAMGQ